jgi:hypothetical protein
MRAPEELNLLAARILERKQNGSPPPYTLFLGEGCAQAAGLPGKQDIALQIFSDSSLAQRYLGDGWRELLALISGKCRENPERWDEECPEAALRLSEAFEQFLDQMSPNSQQRMLQSYYASKAVPAFYQSLALLVKAGFFSHILTTNIDTLFEQALLSTGLQQGRDFRVISLGQREDSSAQNKMYSQFKGYDDIRQQSSFRMIDSSDLPLAVLVVKLHGDIASRQTAYSMDSINAALNSQRSFLRSEFTGDLLFVGYRFESEPINHWLEWVPGEFWWIDSKAPENEQFAALEDRRPVSFVSGPVASPDQFFSYLANQLLSLPASLNPAEDTEEAYTAGSKTTQEVSEEQYLRAELSRNQALLLSLVQSASPGDRSGQAQTDYQRRLVAELEDQLRSLESSQARLLRLMSDLRQACREVGIDPNATSFINSQLKIIRKEYEREIPNQAIVSAAVGAAVLLAERLGSELIDVELIEELASFAPSAWGRRL